MIVNNRLTFEQYQENFADIHPPFENREGAVIEANRCIMCYDAPCIKMCPTHINIPKFIKQIATENLKGSAKTIFTDNIMGASCSKVCPVEILCEGSCVYNLLHEEPIQIARLQRYSTEKAMENNWQLFEKKTSVGKKVAVVGAGPAGLSCAFNLAKEGVEVTIFEKETKGGGLMTYGIAAYKVTPEFCEEEVKYITSIGGIDIKYNQELGKDFQLKDLQTNYDAVFLGIGVGIARQLDINGENSGGVEDAISYIHHLRTNDFSNIPVGERVAVIGLGMTAIDAATQTKRLGAKQVTIVYRRTENEKPCTDVELNIAKLDGCNLEYLAAPKEIISENGNVKTLICRRMKLGEADASGRRSPVDTGETFEIDCDMIIKAAGQTPFEDLISNFELQNSSGKVSVNSDYETNWKGVFAGGDCINGGKEVVNAAQDGKLAARSILEYILN
ncbi:NAD(P)-dependent oxidoreductase [Chryseobacterium sp. ERMR1:04]|uniref:NAD(P)-dependent oxidoreductase n=1 Tax=Chryseobacterium sp. ERMR1:04 TaxID=1705393 RepID=UPI0006C8504D|nr:NAD(P)-dependent oxidoreductase [Chryseobacterium sp. ERMR1:04]KPH12850.1 pyridine nucleotide-disulfide oxidoreductase [Chryseobacterium sp. ERMR1:04]